MNKIASIGMIGVVALLVFTGCKKNDNNPSSTEKINRVKKLSTGTENKVFLYDNDSRLVRINSSDGYSIRFTYSSSEIVMQIYSSNDQPDPQGKYSFTIANGLITSGRKYLPNGAVVHEYGYRYDNQQRLEAVTFNIKDFTGNNSETHNYQLTYDASDNLQQLIFKRSAAGVSSDSGSVTITYLSDKSFITWKNMGFDYFGKAPVGHQLQGQVAIPFSLVEKIHPAQKAVKTVETKNYQWNPGTKNWTLKSSDNQTHPETDYQYNELQWLIKYMSYTIEWDS